MYKEKVQLIALFGFSDNYVYINIYPRGGTNFLPDESISATDARNTMQYNNFYYVYITIHCSVHTF